MIFDQKVTFEVAKLAHTLSFNEEVYGAHLSDHSQDIWYSSEGHKIRFEYDFEEDEEYYQRQVKNLIPRPNQSLLSRWLREVKDIYVTLSFDGYTWDVDILSLTFNMYPEDSQNKRLISTLGEGTPHCFFTFEEAMEGGLLQACKDLKQYYELERSDTLK